LHNALLREVFNFVKENRMQQLLTSANAIATIATPVGTPNASASGEQSHRTDQCTCQCIPCRFETASSNQQSNSFLLPERDEVVRRVWNYERDGQFIVTFFDIWKADIEDHFAFCIYEADTLKPIRRPRHPIQPAVLRLLVETELVPHNASIPFIVRTGKQVDRVTEIGGK
jgi:hypothetical protein